MKKSDPRASAKALSAEAKRWRRRLTDEYALDDEGAALLLQTALEAFDAMRAAQKLIQKDGCVIRDRFDQLKAHPAVVIERDSRAAMLAALKALNLDIEPLNDTPGRPPGTFNTGGS